MEKQKDFLSLYGINPEEWYAANIKEEDLLAIEDDFKEKSSEFTNSANYFANAVQGLGQVHSVRWRIKDPKHLVAKIVRKRAAGSQKYLNISPGNYHEILTDLIGIRAIHLFKEDLLPIDGEIRSRWNLAEEPVIYIREGDVEDVNLTEKFSIKKHGFGYRSAHYIIESSPSKQKITAELQVRTIFEEGWSEIDHFLRYPNHSENSDIKSILTIFNRMAGSADEIASFTLRLSRSLTELNHQLDDHKKEAEQAKEERDASVNKIDSLLKELESGKEKTHESTKLIKQMQAELETIKLQNSKDNAIAVSATQVVPASDSSKNGAALLAALAALAMIAK
jgi:ppGpp synthetase/RelA/SpoT-type nucleotidyltranferase